MSLSTNRNANNEKARTMFGSNLNTRVDVVEREISEVKSTLSNLEQRTGSMEINQGKIISGMEASRRFIVVTISIVSILSTIGLAVWQGQQNKPDVEIQKQMWMMEMQLEQLKNQGN